MRSAIRSPGNAPRSGSASNSVDRTGAPVSASKDALPTNRSLVGVWITRTACPDFTASRIVSIALYAAMPPLTPMSNRATARPDYL